MPQNKVLFVVAHTGYQPVEYSEPKRIIEAEGFRVFTASNKPGVATAKDGSKATVDVTLTNVQIADYDAIIFIGGPGALENLDSEESYELIREAFADEKIIGAICVAPRILARAGILTNIYATGWDEDGKLADVFKEFDVKLVREPLAVDSDIVTAQGPAAAHDFGIEIVRLLKSKRA